MQNLFCLKKVTLSSTDFSGVSINNQLYVSMSILPLLMRTLQRKKMIHHVLYLGSAVTIKLTEQTLSLKTYHEIDISYGHSDGIAE